MIHQERQELTENSGFRGVREHSAAVCSLQDLIKNAYILKICTRFTCTKKPLNCLYKTNDRHKTGIKFMHIIHNNTKILFCQQKIGRNLQIWYFYQILPIYSVNCVYHMTLKLSAFALLSGK